MYVNHYGRFSFLSVCLSLLIHIHKCRQAWTEPNRFPKVIFSRHHVLKDKSKWVVTIIEDRYHVKTTFTPLLLCDEKVWKCEAHLLIISCHGWLVLMNTMYSCVNNDGDCGEYKQFLLCYFTVIYSQTNEALNQ